MSKDSPKGVGLLNYSHYEVHLSMWDVVVIKLDGKAYVMLMDNLNFTNFINDQPHRYYGGFTETSPYRIPAPNTGSWNLVIKPEGNIHQLKHSIQIIRN